MKEKEVRRITIFSISILNIVLIPGRWHTYSQQSQAQLNSFFASGAQQCQITINGTSYEIDFSRNKQIQTNDRTRSRNIKREFAQPRQGHGMPQTQNNYSNMFPGTSTTVAPDDILGRELFRLTSGHLIVIVLLAFLAYTYFSDSMTSSEVNEKSSENMQMNKRDDQIDRWARGFD